MTNPCSSSSRFSVAGTEKKETRNGAPAALRSASLTSYCIVWYQCISRINSLNTPARDHSHHPRLCTLQYLHTNLSSHLHQPPAICKSSQPRVPPISSLNSTVVTVQYISKAAACLHTSTKHAQSSPPRMYPHTTAKRRRKHKHKHR
jgi:hypothetical protein